MATLERAIQIAAEAHAGQTDKAGQPYILHSMRVMLDMRTDDERIVAALHDVVEDCPAWPLSRLEAEGFSAEVVAALVAITRANGEAYEQYIDRLGLNLIARAVKKGDLKDNMDPRRMELIDEPERTRLHKRYFHAFGALL